MKQAQSTRRSQESVLAPASYSVLACSSEERSCGQPQKNLGISGGDIYSKRWSWSSLRDLVATKKRGATTTSRFPEALVLRMVFPVRCQKLMVQTWLVILGWRRLCHVLRRRVACFGYIAAWCCGGGGRFRIVDGSPPIEAKGPQIIDSQTPRS